MLEQDFIAIRPADDEAAVGQCGHRRDVLGAGYGVVDAELATHGIPGRVVTLAIDAPAARILVAVGAPDHDVAAVVQRRHVLLVLTVGGVGVGAELGAVHRAVGVEALTVDAGAAAILIVGTPHHHIATIGERGCLRAVLGVGLEAGAGVHFEHIAAADTGTREVLAPDLGPSVVGLIVVCIPQRHEAATLQGSQCGLRLVVVGVGRRRVVDDEFGAGGGAGVVEGTADHVVAG